MAFQWERVDWIKWMPVEVALILFIILLIRLLRRIKRWGHVNVSHVQLSKIDINNVVVWKYLPRKLEIDTSSAQLSIQKQKNTTNLKRILYISPLTGKVFKKNVFPVSLSLLGFSIIHIKPSQLFQILKSYSHPWKGFQKILIEYKIHTVIFFDFLSPYIYSLFDGMNQYEDDKNKKNFFQSILWINIRPILSFQQLNSLLYLLPFTTRWIALINLFLFRFKYSFKIQEQLQIYPDNLPKNLFFIQPEKSCNKMKGDQEIQNLASQIKERKDLNGLKVFNQIKKGGWNFYRNETVLVGLISSYLYSIEED